MHKIIIDETIGQKAGDFLRVYQKSHNLTLADALIAATSEHHHLKLWTLNTKHYPMFSEDHFIR